MKQVLGNDLTEPFSKLSVDGKMVYKGEQFEVWELSEDGFERLNTVSDEEWMSLAPENNGWWRYGSCVYEGREALYPYEVNGQRMFGYCNPTHGYTRFKEDLMSEYSSYTDWLRSVFSLSNVSNQSWFAISLSKANGLTLAEFMTRYQP